MIVFTSHNSLKRCDCLFELNLNTVRACEDFGNVEWLAEETLDLTGAGHCHFVLFAQFVHAENRDDVLQGFVALKDLLNSHSHIIVLFTNDLWIKQA